MEQNKTNIYTKQKDFHVRLYFQWNAFLEKKTF